MSQAAKEIAIGFLAVISIAAVAMLSVTISV